MRKPKLEIRKDVKRPFYFIRVTAAGSAPGEPPRRQPQRIGYVDEISPEEAMNARAQVLEALNPDGIVVREISHKEKQELRRLRSTWPRPTDRDIWREMIRAELFTDGIWFLEMDMVESVAQEILKHQNSPYYLLRWAITPELIDECSRIVELTARVSWQERHPECRSLIQRLLQD